MDRWNHFQTFQGTAHRVSSIEERVTGRGFMCRPTRKIGSVDLGRESPISRVEHVI